MSDRIGTGGFSYQRVVVEDNTRTGSETTYTFEGTEALCTNQRVSEIAAGASETVLESIPGSIDWRLVSRYPYNQYGGQLINGVVPSIHELVTETTQEDWRLSPVLFSLLGDVNGSSLIQQIIAVIESVAQDYLARTYIGDTTTTAESLALADLIKRLPAAASGSQQSTAIVFFAQRAFLGVSAYESYNSVYRRTITAARKVDVEASYTGVGQIWTSEEITAFESIPSGGIFQLDSQKQWLKSKPDVTAAAGQKTQVSYHYREASKWSGFLYTPYGSASLYY